MLDKILQYLKDFIKSRNVLFYVAFGVAVLAFIFGIVATAGLAEAGCGALPIVFTLLGLLAFIGLSLVGHEWAAAGAVGVFSFMSIVAVLCNVYSFYLGRVQDLAMTGINIGALFSIPGIVVLILSLVVFLLCAIASNVFAWLRLRKKDVAPAVAASADSGEAASETEQNNEQSVVNNDGDADNNDGEDK